MAHKERYLAYAQAMKKGQKKRSSPGSILKRLKELQDQDVVLHIPIEGAEDGE